jgi:F-type H+-transporting ATPase subunit gamma
MALFRAHAESLASENASRLASMQAAENNIEEKIDDLAARYRRRRQSAITEELLDVVSGFEALGGVG